MATFIITKQQYHVAYTLGGVKMGIWLTGKLGRAWVVHGIGAWHEHGCLVVVVMWGCCGDVVGVV